MFAVSFGAILVAIGPVGRRILAVGSSPIVVSAPAISSFIRIFLKMDRSGSLGIGAV